MEWYIRRGVRCHIAHLVERTRQVAQETDLSTPEGVKTALRKRIASIDFKDAANDVRPFLKDASCLDIWSTDYFNALTDMMQFA